MFSPEMYNSLFETALTRSCYVFHQQCLIVYSRLLLEVHTIFSTGMSYNLFWIAVRRRCFFVFIRNA